MGLFTLLNGSIWNIVSRSQLLEESTNTEVLNLPVPTGLNMGWIQIAGEPPGAKTRAGSNNGASNSTGVNTTVAYAHQSLSI